LAYLNAKNVFGAKPQTPENFLTTRVLKQTLIKSFILAFILNTKKKRLQKSPFFIFRKKKNNNNFVVSFAFSLICACDGITLRLGG
jgi:hypothetical protein